MSGMMSQMLLPINEIEWKLPLHWAFGSES